MRSSIPPCPGKIVPESLTPALRFQADSKRSPIWPATLPTARHGQHVRGRNFAPVAEDGGHEQRSQKIRDRALPGFVRADLRGHFPAADAAAHEISRRIAHPNQDHGEKKKPRARIHRHRGDGPRR